jgi:hypothetical protein
MQFLGAFMRSDTAAVSVFMEQPVLSHFARRNPLELEETARSADMIASLHSSLQQELNACDFVSCFACGSDSFYIFLSQHPRKVDGEEGVAQQGRLKANTGRLAGGGEKGGGRSGGNS